MRGSTGHITKVHEGDDGLDHLVRYMAANRRYEDLSTWREIIHKIRINKRTDLHERFGVIARPSVIVSAFRKSSNSWEGRNRGDSRRDQPKKVKIKLGRVDVLSVDVIHNALCVGGGSYDLRYTDGPMRRDGL